MISNGYHQLKQVQCGGRSCPHLAVHLFPRRLTTLSVASPWPLLSSRELLTTHRRQQLATIKNLNPTFLTKMTARSAKPLPPCKKKKGINNKKSFNIEMHIIPSIVFIIHTLLAGVASSQLSRTCSS